MSFNLRPCRRNLLPCDEAKPVNQKQKHRKASTSAFSSTDFSNFNEFLLLARLYTVDAYAKFPWSRLEEIKQTFQLLCGFPWQLYLKLLSCGKQNRCWFLVTKQKEILFFVNSSSCIKKLRQKPATEINKAQYKVLRFINRRPQTILIILLFSCVCSQQCGGWERLFSTPAK